MFASELYKDYMELKTLSLGDAWAESIRWSLVEMPVQWERERGSQQHDHKSFCFCFAVTVSSWVQCFIFFLTETFSEIVASDRLFLLFWIFFLLH